MSFLSFIASWAEEHIPLVGSKIAELVEKLEDAIESAYDWVKDTVNWIENTWIKWAEKVILEVKASIAVLKDKIDSYLTPMVNWLKNKVMVMSDQIEEVALTLKDLIASFPAKVWSAIPDWIKNGAKKALDEIPQLWRSLNSLWDSFTSWLNTKEAWFQEQLHDSKNLITLWIHEVTDPISTWINWFKSEFQELLEDPVKYIRSVMSPVLDPLIKAFSGFVDWVEEKVNGFTDAISSIDDFLLSKLEGFVLGLVKWFIASFIDDLAHLKYDPETKQVYGTPKNPLTHILIWFFEVEKPENPYQSVKGKMNVRDYEVVVHD